MTPYEKEVQNMHLIKEWIQLESMSTPSAAHWSNSMTDTPNRSPLWEVLQDAGSNAPGTPRDAIAAEIRALRDWLVPEEPLYDGDQRWELERDERQRLRALLTTEADRAERGDG